VYLEYWELKEKPFENTPDPRFFFQSHQHQEALLRLLYALHEEKGAALLTGEYGCGKTLTLRTVINEIDPLRFAVVLLTNPRWTAEELLREIAYQLGSDEVPERKVDVMHLINDQLYKNLTSSKHTVLIIDEAQVIHDPMTFEELRLLLNFQLNDRFMLTLIFSGQPELRDRIRSLPQLVQRISVKYHLVPLELEETSKYINYRMAVAGSLREVFTSESIKEIYTYSGGTPRKINNLCDLALAIGVGSRMEKITPPLVRSIIESETAGGKFEW